MPTKSDELNARLVQAVLDGAPYFAVFEGPGEATEMIASCPPDYLQQVVRAACFALAISNTSGLTPEEAQQNHAQLVIEGMRLAIMGGEVVPSEPSATVH